jgi:hypothetical protein
VSAIGTARDYEGLQTILRTRAEALKVSRETLDEIAGLPRGYGSKVLAPVPMRKLGPKTLGPMLGVLGLKLDVVEDTDALKYAARASLRCSSQVRNGSGHRLIKKITWLWSRRKARQMRQKQLSTLSAAARRRIAKKGWKTRRKRRAVPPIAV